MTTETHSEYQAMLDTLRAKQAKVRQELTQLETAIAALEGLAGSPQTRPSRAMPSAVPAQPLTHPDGPAINLNAISVRWAVLAILSDFASGPMTTGQIAEELQRRGVKKDTKSPFGNIVSAVISNLRSKGELETVGDGLHQLTDAGRDMWRHIKSGPRFQSAQSASIEPTLLDAQSRAS